MEIHSFFPELAEEESLIEDFSCALHKEILVQGRLYLTELHCCFKSQIFVFGLAAVIPFIDIISIEKKNAAFLFPTAIEIETKKRKYFFASFIYREQAYNQLCNLWYNANPDAPKPKTQKSTIPKHLKNMSAVPIQESDFTETSESESDCECPHFQTVILDTNWKASLEDINDVLLDGFEKRRKKHQRRSSRFSPSRKIKRISQEQIFSNYASGDWVLSKRKLCFSILKIDVELHQTLETQKKDKTTIRFMFETKNKEIPVIECLACFSRKNSKTKAIVSASLKPKVEQSSDLVAFQILESYWKSISLSLNIRKNNFEKISMAVEKTNVVWILSLIVINMYIFMNLMEKSLNQ